MGRKKRRRKRQRKTPTNPITPTEMIQSTELAFKNSYAKYSEYPDWTPVTSPFPSGVRPKTYKGYHIVKPPYRIEIPQWGINLDPKKWFYGRYGLWHKSFDSRPFYLTYWNEDLVRTNCKDKYYFLEVKHRLWAYGDHILTIDDQTEFDCIPHYMQESEKLVMNKLMEQRRRHYHEGVLEKFRSSKKQFLPPTKSLEGHCKFNKRKISKLIKDDPQCRLRLETMDEIRAIARKSGFPVPVFDKKGYWVNKPNPDYKPPTQLVPYKESAPQAAVIRIGKGHRLNQKTKIELLSLLSKLQLPWISKLKRHHLRWVRCLDRHLNNIIGLSETVRGASPKRQKGIVSDIHKLIKAVPFKSFGRNQSGSFSALPSWARRLIVKNLWS